MMITRTQVTIVNTSIITLKLVAIKTVELLLASLIPLVGMTTDYNAKKYYSKNAHLYITIYNYNTNLLMV